MNRRALLKTAGITGLSTLLPFSKNMASPPAAANKNGVVFPFTLGDLELMIITDGHALFQPAQPIFAPGVAPAAVAQLLHDNFLPETAVDVSLNILVLKKGKDIVVFDTGCGNNFGPQAGKLLQQLQAAGIQPDDVTAIFLTHAHPDHVGGLLQADDVPVFPHATIYVSETEYKFWISDKPDFSRSKFPDKEAVNFWVALAKKSFTAYRSKIKLFQDGETILGCIKTRIVPGHTPGHTLAHIFSGNEELIHMADTVHDHVLLLSHPEWGVGFDTDFTMAAKARIKLLGELSDKRSHVFSYHLPWPGLGHVRRKDQHFEWVGRAIATI